MVLYDWEFETEELIRYNKKPNEGPIAKVKYDQWEIQKKQIKVLEKAVISSIILLCYQCSVPHKFLAGLVSLLILAIFL